MCSSRLSWALSWASAMPEHLQSTEFPALRGKNLSIAKHKRLVVMMWLIWRLMMMSLLHNPSQHHHSSQSSKRPFRSVELLLQFSTLPLGTLDDEDRMSGSGCKIDSGQYRSGDYP